MRRVCVLCALVVLAWAVLAGAGGQAEARARHKKSYQRAPPPAAAVAGAGAPTKVLKVGSKVRPQRKKKARWRAPRPAVTVPDAVQGVAPEAVPEAEPAAPVPETAATEANPPAVLRPRRLLVLGFDGRGAQMARSAALGALGKIPSLHLLPLRPADALRIGTVYGPEKSKGLARRLNLTATLYGQVTQARRNIHVTLTLANGEDGQIVGEIAFDGRTPAAVRTKIRAQLWEKLQPLIDQAASPGPPDVPREGEGGGRDAGARQGERTEAKPAPKPPGLPPAAPPPARPPPRIPRPLPHRPAAPETEGGQAPVAGEAKPLNEGNERNEGEVAKQKLERPVPMVSPRAEAPPAGEEEVEEGAAAEAHPTPPGPPCPWAEIEGAGGVMLRRFNYRGEQRGALRGYNLYRAPVARVEGTFFPFAVGGCGAGRLTAGLGLRLAYERMAPVTSRLPERALGTQASAYQAELILRVVHGTLTIEPAVGYFVRQYSVDGGVVPAADYRALGAGIDARLRLGLFTIELGAGGRLPLRVGGLESAGWFPGLSSYGVAGRGRLVVAMNNWIDILAGGSIEYFSFHFNIDPAAANPNGVASGAYDVYLQGLLSVRLRLGVTGHGVP